MKNLLLTALSAIFLFFNSNIIFAQAPVLGTAGNFVLFTTVGAVTNTGISQITGDVGTNTGAVTGFGNVNGIVQSPPNGATNTAAAELLLAYDQLNTATPTSTTHAPLLGNGEILTPGVYEISGVTTLSGVLFLDAQGDSNAVFIFQIQAAFSSSFAAKVKMLNGTQSCNVYWKVEGAVNLASETFFRGTIVAHNDAIAMSVKDTLEGRALAIAGAITLDGTMAYLPAGCGVPLPIGPAAPNLGTAACFAIFSGSGPVTNSGITYARGDVGTNVGLTTGYDSLFVNGKIHPIPDGVTSAAKDDLLVAYDYLNLLAHDIELLYPAQFGNDLVLTPQVYLLNAATALTGNVFLNAQGIADAVFVIKINGAFTTSTFSKVKLVNGTQAKNVYWKVEGAVSISDYSVFNGTMIANNGAIDLAIGDSVNGRILTTTGAVTTAASVVTIPTGTCSTLPVTWLSFTAQKNSNASVMLKWSTAAEINNSHFNVERSTDGINFTAIGTVASTSNGNTVQYYLYTDVKTVKGNNFYRLQQVDRDGSYKYSVIVQVNMVKAAFSVFPNPATTKTTVQVRSMLNNASFSLINYDGKIVYLRSLIKVNAGEFIDIPLTNFAPGMYMLTIESDEGKSTRKIIVQ